MTVRAFSLTLVAAALALLSNALGAGTLVTYDWPTGPGEAIASDKYSVTVTCDGVTQNLKVLMSEGWEEENPNNANDQNYGGPRYFRGRTFSWANFSSDFASPVTVEVTKLFGAAANDVAILPSGYNVTRVVSDDGMTVRFTLFQSRYVAVFFRSADNQYKVDDLQKNMFVLFADPLEENVPDKNAAGTLVFDDATTTQADINAADVVYFERGHYDLRGQLNVNAYRNGNEGQVSLDGYIFPKSGQQIYLEGGAFVEGKVFTAERDQNNANLYHELTANGISIRGRGAFSGRGWGWLVPESIAALIELKGNNHSIEGIFGFDNDMHGINPGWTATMRNVKVWGWHYNNDGFRPWGGTVDHCFSRPVDDAFYVGGTGTDLRVRDTVIWQSFNGGIVTCGWGTYDTARFWMEDCHIIWPEWKDKGNNNGVLMSQQAYAARSWNINFNNVRVDGNVVALTNLKMKTGGATTGTAGGISGVSFKNVTVTGRQQSYNNDRTSSFDSKSLIAGTGLFRIENVAFDNVRIGGVLLTEANKDTYFDIDASTTSGIVFKNTNVESHPDDFPGEIEYINGEQMVAEFATVYGNEYELEFTADGARTWQTHDQRYYGTGEPIKIPLLHFVDDPAASYLCRLREVR